MESYSLRHPGPVVATHSPRMLGCPIVGGRSPLAAPIVTVLRVPFWAMNLAVASTAASPERLASAMDWLKMASRSSWAGTLLRAAH